MDGALKLQKSAVSSPWSVGKSGSILSGDRLGTTDYGLVDVSRT